MTTATFDAAVQNFRDMQEIYADFGACDTEPRAEFFLVVSELFEGRDPEVPHTVRGWQLFSGMTGAGRAARELTKAARKVVAAGQAEPEAVAAFVRNN